MKPYLLNQRKYLPTFSATIKTSLFTTYTILLKHKIKMSFFDASSALTTNNLIRYFSVSSHTPDNIMSLNLSIAKATSHL